MARLGWDSWVLRPSIKWSRGRWELNLHEWTRCGALVCFGGWEMSMVSVMCGVWSQRPGNVEEVAVSSFTSTGRYGGSAQFRVQILAAGTLAATPWPFSNKSIAHVRVGPRAVLTFPSVLAVALQVELA